MDNDFLLRCGMSAAPILLILGAGCFVALSRPRSLESIRKHFEGQSLDQDEINERVRSWETRNPFNPNLATLSVLTFGPLFGLLIALTNFFAYDLSGLGRMCLATMSVFALHAILIFGPTAGYWRNYSRKEQATSIALAGVSWIGSGLFLVGLWQS